MRYFSPTLSTIRYAATTTSNTVDAIMAVTASRFIAIELCLVPTKPTAIAAAATPMAT